MMDEFKIGMTALVIICVAFIAMVAYLGGMSSINYQKRYDACIERGGSFIATNGDGMCLQGLKVIQ